VPGGLRVLFCQPFAALKNMPLPKVFQLADGLGVHPGEFRDGIYKLGQEG